MSDSPKNLHNKILGRQGEKLIARYLKKRGYRILETNYATPFGEADLIALKDGTYCFVEVKTRTTDAFGRPAEAVDGRKRERYRRIASFYCARLKKELDCRFDVASVTDGGIEYFEGAY